MMLNFWNRSSLLLFDFSCVAPLYVRDFYSAYAKLTIVFNYSFNSEKPTPSFIIQVLSTLPLQGGEDLLKQLASLHSILMMLHLLRTSTLRYFIVVKFLRKAGLMISIPSLEGMGWVYTHN